jgi:MtN3 and saliva related transmembrane protein
MGLEILAFLAGLIGAVSTIPQIYQMVKTKQTRGISTQMFMMKNIAYTLWMAFGYFSGSFAIILWNFFALALSSAVVVMKYKILSEEKQKSATPDFLQDEMVETPKKHHLKLVYSKH